MHDAAASRMGVFFRQEPLRNTHTHVSGLRCHILHPFWGGGSAGSTEKSSLRLGTVSQNSPVTHPGGSGGFNPSGLMTEAKLCRLSGLEPLLFLRPVFHSLSFIRPSPQRGQQSLLSCYSCELLKKGLMNHSSAENWGRIGVPDSMAELPQLPHLLLRL